MSLYSDGGAKENQTIKTEENVSYFADATEKLSILQASTQPEGLSFRIIKNMENRNIQSP